MSMAKKKAAKKKTAARVRTPKLDSADGVRVGEDSVPHDEAGVQYGCAGYLETSAKNERNANELRERIAKELD